MNESLVPILLLGAWTIFSILYIIKFKRNQLNIARKKSSFWNNQYIFDSIPSVFPTLGILCTAIGITYGLWNFNANDIQASIPQLLNGLKLAFIATILGILGLIIFQKITAIVQKSIDDDPNRPVKSTDELTALAEIKLAIDQMKNSSNHDFKELLTYQKENNSNFTDQIKQIETELTGMQVALTSANENFSAFDKKLSKLAENNTKENNLIAGHLKELKEEQSSTGKKANENTAEIIKAMGSNNTLISKKFDEFSDLLAKNNTEALVEVMKTATEQFNSQMRDLIDKLVQENFKELNNSVQNLNTWQQENKEQIAKLTNQFKDVSDNLQISATTLNEVAQKTKELTADNGKLSELIVALQNVLINDTKFMEMTEKIDKSITSLQVATVDFEDFAAKVNHWANHQSGMNDTMVEVVAQLKEFKDFNGNLWNNYRKEMNESVNIIKNASQMLGKDIDKINEEFMLRLNDTLANLDACIQTIMENHNV